ncbi:unnamed protein product [Chironomus riparius]|uniref:histone acetyltransferase n=1 Tax=Chironomus riparius TaxID=315576 RepID=A0A9N9RSV8_9DIPT|nr:unnamed protein product [Chironomus riparius]
MSSVEASIAQGLNVLEHSIYCCFPECEFFKCSNMKCLLDHLRECKPKHSANCVVCKELLALICRHARFCYNQHCRIPYCTVMKDNMDYSEDSDVEPVDVAGIKKEIMDNYRGTGSRKVNTNSFEPPRKKRRLQYPSKVKKEFGFSSTRSIPLPAFSFPSPTKFPTLAQHLTDKTAPTEQDTDMRRFDSQPSTSEFNPQFLFPADRLNDAYNLYYSTQNNSNNRNIYAARKSSY